MPASKISADQLDLVATDLEAAGTNTRQLSLKGGAVAEGKLVYGSDVDYKGTGISGTATDPYDTSFGRSFAIVLT